MYILEKDEINEYLAEVGIDPIVEEINENSGDFVALITIEDNCGAVPVWDSETDDKFYEGF